MGGGGRGVGGGGRPREVCSGSEKMGREGGLPSEEAEPAQGLFWE